MFIFLKIQGMESGRSHRGQHVLVCTQEGLEGWAGATQARHPEEGVAAGQDLMRLRRERLRGSGFRVCQGRSMLFL